MLVPIVYTVREKRVVCAGTEIIMKEVFTAKKSDFQEVTEFINMVFDEDFPEFMEKVYTEENFVRATHLCIRENGKIAACVGLYPQKIQYDDRTAECVWIGSVSVAPDKRGLGYMKELMAEADRIISERKLPFAYLSGRRNRYGFFGYEIMGIRNFFVFEEENIRLTTGFDVCSSYEFTPLYEDNKADLENVLKLYAKRKVRVRAEEDMVAAMKTWGFRPYTVKKSNEFQGYLLIKDGHIAEIELLDYGNLLNVCGAVLLCFGLENVKVEAREWEREKCRELAAVCEKYSTETLGNMKIYDYAAAYEFFMGLESRIRRLKYGRLTIHVSMACTFYIEVGETGIKTGYSDHEEADLFVTSAQLIRLTFTKGNGFITDFDNEFVKNWFPLSYTPETVDEF